MHILEIPSFFPPYGGAFCLDQAKALQALGYEVRILSNVQLGVTIGLKEFLTLPYTRFEHELEGVTVCQSYQRGLPRSVRYNVRRWVNIVKEMFAQYVERYGCPDMLHAHCAKWAGYAAMLISEQYHIPYVITEHLSIQLFVDEFGPAPSKAWQIPLLKEAYQRASRVVHVSEEQAESLSCYFGKDYRWQAISNIIDVDFFSCQARQPAIGRPFRFCCLANYWPLKGYDVLFEAFNRLTELDHNVELHIAGKGTDSGECLAHLSEKMISHGLLNKEQVRDLLYHCDALVLASRSEAQPLVLLEAMSTGIPVVSTECVPRCQRIDGCTIVPIDDAEALAAAMQRVMEIPVDAQLLHQQVAELASPQVIGKRLEAIFTEILSSR